MKYSIIKCINGAFSVDSEHGELTQAKSDFMQSVRHCGTPQMSKLQRS